MLPTSLATLTSLGNTSFLDSAFTIESPLLEQRTPCDTLPSFLAYRSLPYVDYVNINLLS